MSLLQTFPTKTDETGALKPQTSIIWPHRSRGSIDLSALQISPTVIGHTTQTFQLQETIRHDVGQWMKIGLIPKARGKTSPCQMLPLMALPMKAKTKSRHPTRSPRPRQPGRAVATSRTCQHECDTRENPPQIIRRLECKRLLQRIGFNKEAAQAIVCNHEYNTAKKLSHLPMMWTSFVRPYVPQAENKKMEQETQESMILT